MIEQWRDNVSGELSGIQPFHDCVLKPDRDAASFKCPVCGVGAPHGHGIEDLRELERKVAFLKMKLGISP